MLNNQIKYCNKCQIDKPLNEFSKSKRYKDGLQTKCKACAKQYEENNKERITVRKKQHYESNKVESSTRCKKYREENKQCIATRTKQWRENNREKISELKRQYYEEHKDGHIKQYREINKEKMISQRKQYHQTKKGKASKVNSEHKRRAVKKQGDVTTPQLLELQQTAKICYWCNTSLKNKVVHIDHYVPLSKGGEHTLSNLVISCAKCNLSKSSKDPIEFANIVGKLL